MSNIIHIDSQTNEHDTPKIVHLVFPYSTTNHDHPDKFAMSYNCAVKSDFIGALLETIDVIESDSVYEIVIPRNLYVGVRHVEIKKLVEIWTTACNDPVNHLHYSGYCCKDIARLSQALCLDDSIPLINRLNELYPPYPPPPLGDL